MFELSSNSFESFQTLPAPFAKANHLAVANVEKLVAFQMNLLQSYVDLGMKWLKASTEVRDPESLRAFYINQLEAVALLPQKVLEDLQALSELGAGFQAEFTEQAQESARETAELGTSKTASAAKDAARKAA